MPQFIQSRGDIHNGQLPLRVPAYEAQGEQQVSTAPYFQTTRGGTQAFLHDQTCCQDQQTQEQDRYFQRTGFPGLDPLQRRPIGRT